MAMATRRTRLTMIVAACAAVSAVTTGCSRSSDEIAIDPTTTQSTTTWSTTTTTEPATTETTPTTTTDDEAAVRELHEHYLTDVAERDEREVTLEEQVDELRSVSVDPVLTRSIESIEGHYQRGEYAVNPGGETNIIDVTVTGDRAIVDDCFLGLGVLYSRDDTVLIPADTEHQLIELEYVKIDGQWFVTEFYTIGETCDPADYS